MVFAVIVGSMAVFSVTSSASVADIALTTDDYPMLNVPQIHITTADGNGTTLQKDDGYVDASIVITDTEGSTLSDSVKFKVRGNTTAMTGIQKKAYTFKFTAKKNVLGLGSGKKWALLANAFDPTMLRNRIANDIAHELSLEYTSNKTFVELWVDSSYRGCYELFEPVEEGRDRVDIDIESNGGKHDFLIEYEAQRVEADVTYFTVDGLRFIASDPDEPDDEQLEYIKSTMQGVIDTLKTGSREDIQNVIDVDSFAKYYFLNEYVKTFDFDMSSVFYYYKNGKLYAGPAWDYDLSAGNSNDSLNGKRYKAAVPTDGIYIAEKNLYRYLCDKDWFYDVVTGVYRDHYYYFSNIYVDGGLMDTLYAEYKDVFDRNFSPSCWRVSRGWINIQKPPLATYQENFDYLKNWYRARDSWLSGYFDPLNTPRIIGDANGNGLVCILDSTAIQRYLASLSTLTFIRKAADADGDGMITILDANAIQRYLAQLSCPEEIGKSIT